jgi:hypothetical protein
MIKFAELDARNVEFSRLLGNGLAAPVFGAPGVAGTGAGRPSG